MVDQQSNVLQFPRSAPPLSARRRASQDLRARFSQRGGVSKDVYEHLALKMHQQVERIRAQFGERSGALSRAFGENFLKQKKRFTSADGAGDHVLCQNPGNWLQVIDGVADVLGLSREEFLLEMFAGSSLLPCRRKSGYQREEWLGSFEELMNRLSSKVEAHADIASVCRYLHDAALGLDGGNLVPIEHQDEEPFIDSRFTYPAGVLSQLPHVLGLNYRDHPHEPVGLENSPEFVRQFGLLYELPDAGLLQPDIATRVGMAIALDATDSLPRLALFEWGVSNVNVFARSGQHVATLPLDAHWCEFDGEEIGAIASPIANRVQFCFLGSDEFQRVVSSPIAYPYIWSDPDLMWDPGGSVELAADFPTAAPARTTAAAIERNLLYADGCSRLEDRLDLILEDRAQALERLVIEHREEQRETIEVATAALLAEWQASSAS